MIKNELKNISVIKINNERQWLNSHDSGYQKLIGKRHIQMITLGGAIGTGLFLGTGARLQLAGPSLVLIYLICGIFSFFVARALGELVIYRPSSGSFVSYAREFIGEKASYVTGWMYFLNWTMTGIADITAISLYMHYWKIFTSIPQWIFSMIALIAIVLMNLVSVKWFAEIEFWFALVKILAIILFLLIGIFFLILKSMTNNYVTGLSVIIKNGDIFPKGIFSAFTLIQGVIFAFAATEMIGITAGECENVFDVIPKVINGIVWRISIFYFGSILLLVLVLPWNTYIDKESPFVTFFSKLGIPYMDSVMNIVVLTASFSSLNSGLYSTGRILRSMSNAGSAPKFLGLMNCNKVPYMGIICTAIVHGIGVYLNYIIPEKVFEIVLNLASLGIISCWILILLCQMRLRKAINTGAIDNVEFKMPGAPFTAWLTLLFLFSVVVLMAFNYPIGTRVIVSIPFLVFILYLGWFCVRKRVEHILNKRHIN